ncbi:MAG: hypothetical protein M3R54_04945 [Chloroflexota bacterium]|nr:hypothetical protein [Chloroflexota bacterium]
MRRIARLLARATLCALLLLAVSASAALAQSGQYVGSPGANGQANVLPEDPGLE